MNKMFEKTVINGMELSNRFIRSATFEAMADTDGAATSKLTETMTALAKGGVGLVITGHAFIREEGRAAPMQLGIYKDELIPGLRKLTDEVHANGGKIIIQLSHAGNAAYSPNPLRVTQMDTGADTKGREITLNDIAELIKAFADAAGRAKEAGFDGVQIHSAHGYLLSQFLTPALNQRIDQYGGSIENRTRIHVEIIQAVREQVGKDYPILLKLNGQDFIENGLTLNDSLEAARILAGTGIDAIELSGGSIFGGKLSPSRPSIKSSAEEAYFRVEAETLKKQTNIPIILVGGMRSFQVAEMIVEKGIADYVSLSRPLIREPELINRWKSGNLDRALCLSDNLCLQNCLSGKGVYCMVEDRKLEAEKDEFKTMVQQ